MQAWARDNFTFLSLFLTAVIAVYRLPFLFNQLFFLSLILLSFKSKKDYFWIAFFFVLIDAPGRLFQGGLLTDTHRLAFYPLSRGIVIQFTELFIFVYLLKSLQSKGVYRFVFKNDFIFLIFYAAFVFIYSFGFGVGARSVVATARIMLPWSFVYIISKQLTQEFDFDRLNRLLFPVVFIALASQIFFYLNGNYLGLFLKGAKFSEELVFLKASSKTALRAADSSILLLYCFGQALFYLFSKRQVFPKQYLILIIFICTLSVYLSATRGYLVAYLMVFFMILISVRLRYYLKYIIIGSMAASIVLAAVFVCFPVINVQIKNAAGRFYTLVAWAKGEKTVEEPMRRFEIRVPPILKSFKKSPILGWGFSEHYFQRRDMHVGHNNMLLNVGVAGYIILNFFYFKWCYCIYSSSKIQHIKETYGKTAMKILCFILLAIYVVHSTSSMSWGFDIEAAKIIFYALIFSIFNVIYQSGARYQG